MKAVLFLIVFLNTYRQYYYYFDDRIDQHGTYYALQRPAAACGFEQHSNS